MDCRRADELLPWLLNETLDGGERRAVEEHVAGCDRCRASFEETRAALTVYGLHLPVEVLLDLVEGREPEMDRELVERHLASCELCSGELALARQSHEAVEEGESWNVKESDPEPARVVPFETRTGRPAPRRRAPRWQWAAIAALLAGLVAGGLEITRLRNQLAGVPAAQINVAVVDLFPGELILRGQDSAEPAERLPTAERVTLILNTRLPEGGELGVEVFDAGGRVLFERAGLRRGADGLFAVSLTTADLPPGVLTLNVVQEADGRREPLESYRFRVR